MDAGRWLSVEGLEGPNSDSGADSESGVDGFDEAYSPNIRSEGRSTGSDEVYEIRRSTPDNPEGFIGMPS